MIKAGAKNADSVSVDFIMGADLKSSSPSGTAAFVAEASRNGYTEWRTKDGTVLKERK